jgi:hypothetical protein
MGKYRIKHDKVTGKKGIVFHKDNLVDEERFVKGSIDDLCLIEAIEPETKSDSKKTKKDTE